MRVLFDGDLHVHYRQVYVIAGEEFPDDPMGGAFDGQLNGLCGGAVERGDALPPPRPSRTGARS